VSVLRTKSIEQSMADTVEPEHELKKNLGAMDLTVFGVGVIIGTGIFVLTGLAARDSAGPGVALSFVVAGIVCGLAAMCRRAVLDGAGGRFGVHLLLRHPG